MPHYVMPAPNTDLEAAAWADVLLRYGLVHAIAEGPDGQWLAQIRPESTVWLLRDADEVLVLAAALQQQVRAADGEKR
ncbi:hypothetical protein ACFY2W_08075 [Streptomyces sp. NPDC001262]|uniref:hypothetical protein n=1 Tax=Streptomyces sp. NPDC001262 TaxID=3364552 RepID=UPI0036AA9093